MLKTNDRREYCFHISGDPWVGNKVFYPWIPGFFENILRLRSVIFMSPEDDTSLSVLQLIERRGGVAGFVFSGLAVYCHYHKSLRLVKPVRVREWAFCCERSMRRAHKNES